MNRINRLFNNESKSLLAVYFCSGYPVLESTERVIYALDKNGVDMALIGLPSEYSKVGTLIVRDTVAGSLENEITLSLLFQQLRHIRRTAQINTERVMMIARNALYFEDYVLSIQYFNQVINAKPYLYEPY
ncbi:Tryptophan synthase alpha chain, partial [termite gut metagenome]